MTKVGRHAVRWLVVAVLMLLCLRAGIGSASADSEPIGETEAEWYQRGSGSYIVIAPSEKYEGYYVYAGGVLRFHSIATGMYTKITEFTGESGTVNSSSWYQSSYQSDGKLYALCGSTVFIYDLDARKLLKTINTGIDNPTAVGADANGNIFLGTSEKIYVLSASGTKLAEAESHGRVYYFSGFDATNGNFYFEVYYNWVYWGYDHDTHLGVAGSYSGGELKIGNSVIADVTFLLGQNYYSYAEKSMELLNGRYLVGQVGLYSKLAIVDSNALTPGEETEALLMLDRTSRPASGTAKTHGVNVVWCEARNSFLVYITGEKKVQEYSAADWQMVTEYTTEKEVFYMFLLDGQLYMIERDADGSYSIESTPWENPNELVIHGATSVYVGETATLTSTTDSVMSFAIEWSCSDTNVLSITENGVICGWKPGTATVTAKVAGTDVTASIVITVRTNPNQNGQSSQSTSGGRITNNAGLNDYYNAASPMTSYLYENADGTFTRVEYLASDKKILVETYTADKQLKSTKTIAMEAEIFGGFFRGADALYVVEGNKNTEESDDCEVVRVIKYSASWSRLSACSIKGANTYWPFDAGTCRMMELNGMLYVHTCHEMYQSDDGYHHQANMTFKIRESDMTVQDSWYEVMNISYGYVSHSFNQFIKTDGTNIYRLDHGDAHPRSAVVTILPVGNTLTNISSYCSVLQFQSMSSYNNTRANIGGFELSVDNYLVAGRSADQNAENPNYSDMRNVFVLSHSKTGDTYHFTWLTQYGNDSELVPGNPQLVKLSDEQFAVLWEERNTETGKRIVKICCVDSKANVVGKISTLRGRLSDCQPILTKDGRICWYVTDGSTLTWNVIAPLAMDNYWKAPEITKAVGTDNGIRLEWNSVPDVDSYVVYRRENNGYFTALTEVTASRTYYVDKSATAGNNYTYKLKYRIWGEIGPGSEEWVVVWNSSAGKWDTKGKLTFDANGGKGTVPAAVDTLSNTAVTIPKATLTKDGYYFLGWALTSDAKAAAYKSGDSITVNGPVKLYAVWSIRTFKITYVLEDAPDPGNPATYKVTDLTITLKTTAKNGYLFGGWYKDAAFTQKVTEIPQGSFGDLTLYAKFTLRNYKVTYVLNGGTNNPENPATYQIVSPAIYLMAPSKAGCVFDGWYTDEALTKKSSGIAPGSIKDRTFYAKFVSGSGTTRKVSFNLNGGSSGAPAAITAAGGATVTIPSSSPVRKGYYFLGWALKSTATTARYKTGNTVIASSDTVLYAVWSLRKYKITYDLDGAADPGNPATYMVTNGTVTLKNPSKNGYLFGGWYKDAAFTNKVTQITADISGDMKLYAKFTLRTYKITYVLNGGTNNPENPATYQIVSPSIYLMAPSKEGFIFEGWYTDEALTKKSSGIAAGSIKDRTFYAKFAEANGATKKVSFNLNGGASGAPAAITVAGGAVVTVPKSSPVREGYWFLGWALKSTATTARYRSGDTVIASSDTVLYAVWKKK
ncbi:MAG: InlB B-repeat-containing protein [Lachnospiraceae bacterium]|nr:InlB B-repeat-containing protein [Lachnospiraceae bacterium]